MLLFQSAILLILVCFAALSHRNLKDYCPLDPARKPSPSGPDGNVAVLIPARNEAGNIEACVESLLAQTSGDFSLFVLDDGSDDGTDRIVSGLADSDSRIRLIEGKPIPAGWAGKVWACSQLGAVALQDGADWLLFLDADTRAEPHLVDGALQLARETGAGMVSAFPYQETGTLAERVVLPMLHFLIVTFLPIRMVWESPRPEIVAACGQIELFSAAAYCALGGHGAIPGSFHDGLQLARRAKAAGIRVRLFDGCGAIRCRMYRGAREVWSGFTRNAYEGLGGVGALVVMTLLQAVCFLLPFAFLVAAAIEGARGRFPGWGAICLAQILLILWMRLAQAKRFGHVSSVWLHPLSVAAIIAIEWASFWRSLRKTRIAWKGRTYQQ